MNRFVRRFCIFRWRGRRCLDFTRRERVSGVGTGFAWVTRRIVIASEARQSSPSVVLDCFASLAMTGFSDHLKVKSHDKATLHPPLRPPGRPTLGPAV
jgi:hypothetical protein